MPDAHLTPDQIAAIRDRELREWATVRHLQSCPECKSRLREARTLRVLLGRPESEPSSHPGPEALAAYAEATPPSRDVRGLEAHLAACPQCFADLDAIRAYLRPVASAEDAPPEWLIEAVARRFEPPPSPLNLGTLVVEWLHRFGLSLEFIPQSSGGLFVAEAAFDSEASALRLPPIACPAPASRMIPYDRNSLPRNPLERQGPPGQVPEPSRSAVAPSDVSAQAEIAAGDLLARITVRGRARDQLKLLVAVTRQEDDTPVAGVHLALNADGGTIAEVSTDTAGAAEFPLPQGRATLRFLSPIHAELTISF